jgi:hypothetical protein
MKAALRGKIIAMSAYIKMSQRLQINNLVIYTSELIKIRTSQSQN